MKISIVIHVGGNFKPDWDALNRYAKEEREFLAIKWNKNII